MKLLVSPLPVRVFHWVMASSVTILLFTGLYLNNPPVWLHLSLSLVRKLHGIFAALLITNFAGQVYFYIYSKRIGKVLLLPKDWTNVRDFLRYYLFITEGHPNFGRFNPGQKLLFTAWGLMVFVALVTGAGLIFPEETSGLQRMLGGLNTARIIHYLVAVFFTASIPLHIYLVFTEDPAKLQAIFTGYVQQEPSPTFQCQETADDDRLV